MHVAATAHGLPRNHRAGPTDPHARPAVTLICARRSHGLVQRLLDRPGRPWVIAAIPPPGRSSPPGRGDPFDGDLDAFADRLDAAAKSSRHDDADFSST